MLYQHGVRLKYVYPWYKAVRKFFNWLKNHFPQGVILVAHNAFGHDASNLIRELKRSGLDDDEIENVIHGFCDTLVAFKAEYPGITR